MQTSALQTSAVGIQDCIWSLQIRKVVSKVCTFLLQNLLQHTEDIAPYTLSLLEEEKTELTGKALILPVHGKASICSLICERHVSLVKP